MRILVIEDDHYQAKKIATLILDLEGTVYLAKNGLVSREREVLESCDLIITDMNMPLASGLDFLQAYKRSCRENVPTLLHSNSEMHYFNGGKIDLREIQSTFPFVTFCKKDHDLRYIRKFILGNTN